ncbi:transglycosylase family protein [Streptomyces sp. CA-250714]|uniref:transglycosylase family protein n=1 Tax=Streptomyces sp. CA-250714 TaxID=3240060 RepID=UPI003D8CA50E
MRSGNGRHRRPRQAPALFVTAGVTGAGIAIPLLGATGAQAADAGTWDRVADCESGGAWSANNSNGYYGGLQLDLDTWKYYGGTMYAERPDLASRSQQISVGEKILEAEGPRAFPQCGSELKIELPGLDDDESQDADPSPSPTPSETPSDDADESGKPDGSGKPDETDKPDKPGESQSPKPTPDDSADETPSDEETGTPEGGSSESPQPSKPSDDEPSTPKPPHNGPSDDDSSDTSGWSGLGPGGPDRLGSPSEKADKPGKSDKSGKGKHRGRPADEQHDRDESRDRASREKDRDRAREGGGKHRVTVKAGDSLSGIAAEQDVAGGWSALYERNREAIGDDPNLLRPGQQLKL